jgi:hypothetical protein
MKQKYQDAYTQLQRSQQENLELESSVDKMNRELKVKNNEIILLKSRTDDDDYDLQ